MTFPSVLMFSPNPFFCSGEIRLKGVASPQSIQPVQEPGLGWWELGAEGWVVSHPVSLCMFLHPCAHTTPPRFQRHVLIYGSCMNCTPRVTRKNLQGAADLNPY